MPSASKLTSTGGTATNGSYGNDGHSKDSSVESAPARTKSGAGCKDCNDGHGKGKNK